MEEIGKILKKARFKQQLFVDNPVDNKPIPPKKPKILKINTNESIIESNLIEIPFISYNKKKEPVTVVEYTWSDSNNIKRGIEVRGSKYGVPTSYEFDVLIALLRIYVKQKKNITYGENNIFSENDIDDDDVTINFTITEVAREMGYKSAPSGPMIERINQAIETLVDTTIYNRFSGGLYDRSTKSYIMDGKIAFHIIERYESYDYRHLELDGTKRVRGQEIKQFTSLKLNKFFYKSISNAYFKYFNYDMFSNLQSGVGRKLFLILNKWRNNQKYIRIKYETLYERIPLDESTPRFRKNETIKRATQSLIDIGFIKGAEFDGECVKFIFENSIDLEDPQPSYLNKYTTCKEIKEGFINYGFTPEEFNEYLDFIVDNMEYVKALLRYVDMQKLYNRLSDNVKGYICKGLKEKYNLDEKYYEKNK